MLLGVVVGVRVLGPSQFGISVMALALGQLLAFPQTSVERLLVRLVAQGDLGGAAGLIRRAQKASVLTMAIAAAVAVVLLAAGRGGEALFALAAGITAVSTALVNMSQGANRGAGRLAWGQMPNELFRPAATLLSYPVAVSVLGEHSGVVSVALTSAVTTLLVVLAPNPIAGVQPSASSHALSGSVGALMVVSLAAMAVERVYPLIIGWTASAAAVTAFAIVLKVVQLANFTQAFAAFYYSPQLALAAKGALAPTTQQLTLRMRLFGLVSALPAAGVCLGGPGLVEAVFGAGLDLRILLYFAVIAILANALGSPAQNLLIMAGREQVVAVSYGAGSLVSFVAFLSVGGDSALAGTAALAAATFTWSVWQSVAARRIFGDWH